MKNFVKFVRLQDATFGNASINFAAKLLFQKIKIFTVTEVKS